MINKLLNHPKWAIIERVLKDRQALFLPIGIFLAFVLLSLFFIISKPSPTPVTIEEKSWLVDTSPANPASYTPMLRLHGRVESLSTSTLTSGVNAEVTMVHAVEGSEFKEGDLLLELDKGDAALVLAQRQAELDASKARLASAETQHAANIAALPEEKRVYTLIKAEVDRLRNLVSKKLSAQSTLDAALQSLSGQAITLSNRREAIAEHDSKAVELQAEITRAQALRDQAERALARCEVRAPFNGRVASVTASSGQRMREGDTLLTVYDTEAMVVRAQLPNRYLPQLDQASKAGGEVSATSQVDGRTVRVTLMNLSGQISSNQPGVDALFRLNDTSPPRLGRFLRLDVTLPNADGVIALPTQAIYGSDRVYVVDGDNRLTGRHITRMGETRQNGQRHILVSGQHFQADEQIIVTQLPNAIDGLKVRIRGNKPKSNNEHNEHL